MTNKGNLGGDVPQGGESKFAGKAEEIFKNYPQEAEVYFASDGVAFFKGCDAQNHAAGLEDKKVEKVIKQN